MFFEDVRMIVEFVFDLFPNLSLVLEGVDKMVSFMLIMP